MILKEFIVLTILCFTTVLSRQAYPEDDNVVDKKEAEYATETTPTPSVVDIPNIPYVNMPRFNYAEALAKSMLFYEAQRSGKLPSNQRVKWRGDSALNDGQDNNIDLSGGYYDGGSYIKYGYTMAFATTVLSWGVIRYRRAYEILGQLDYVLDTIKWATDYFIKCHPERYVFFGQVSNKDTDEQYWGRPEDMDYRRVSYKITSAEPGSDLAAETAAAMAAASIVFNATDPLYSELLLDHAEQLYDFATYYPGKYSDAIGPAAKAYRSSDYDDDITWAAAWLYKRNGEKRYLREAEQRYNTAKLNTLATEFSWRSKKAGVQVLLAEITINNKKSKYLKAAKMFCDYLQPESNAKFKTRATYTPKGLFYVQKWGSLRYAANSAFLCALAADMKIDSKANRNFAIGQIDYILGKNGRSFVIGFGNNPPTHPFHRSSFCPIPPEKCPRFDNKIPNVHILYGALIGGPKRSDEFTDERTLQEHSSVTIDYNAGFQSALAAVLDLHIFGENTRPHIDEAGTITLDRATLPPPTAAPTTQPIVGVDWSSLLKKSLLFFEAQRSGRAGDNRLPWRGDSALADRHGDHDLSGGYYDGVGYVKYGFPLCYTMTMLSWSLIEYADAYKTAGEYDNAIEVLRWGISYITRTHISVKAGNKTERSIVGQIGDAAEDAKTWDKPESMNQTRKVYTIEPGEHVGTDLACEMSASLAAASIVFRPVDRRYSTLLYNHSHSIFVNFVSRRQQKQKYTDVITQASGEYPSSGYRDEVAWAATWLYQNRRHRWYYRFITQFYDKKRPNDFSWDNKTAGVQLLIGIVRRKPDDIASFCDWLLSEAPKTEKGLLYLNRKYPAKYAATSSFILLLTYEKFRYHPHATLWRDFAVKQLEYLAGYSTSGRSFVIGTGPNQPTQPYHKASSCPRYPPCGFKYRDINAPNPQKLIGALVGGPNQTDEYEDRRLNIEESRVSLDSNAGFQAAVAAMYHLQINNHFGSATNNFICERIVVLYCFVTLFFTSTVTS